MSNSLSAAWTCQQCKKPQRGAKHRTSTGRTVCGACERTQTAAALGMMTTSGTTDAIQQGVAIGGAREWLRRAFGKKG